MEIIDLTEEHVSIFLCCLEDWSEEVKDAGPKRGEWYERAKAEGVRAKLAQDENGVVGGMIQYGPVEQTWAEGSGLYLIYCIWVHGYKEGRGNFQKSGMGRALLNAAEEDARQQGAKGMAAWGISLPFWMKASWFKKHGYSPVDKNEMARLLWKQFTPDAAPPKWIKRKKEPEPVPGQVTVTSFSHGWCMAQNLVYERAKRAAGGFGDNVVFQEYDTSDLDVLREWGITDALYIDGKSVRTGPPPKYEKIRKKIAKRVRRL